MKRILFLFVSMALLTACSSNEEEVVVTEAEVVVETVSDSVSTSVEVDTVVSDTL
jgi:uncharacterized protein YcfL